MVIQLANKETVFISNHGTYKRVYFAMAKREYKVALEVELTIALVQKLALV
jgi:hypothetical protein